TEKGGNLYNIGNIGSGWKKQAMPNDRGTYIQVGLNDKLHNSTSVGDSGSGLLAWDKNKNSWVILGALSTGGAYNSSYSVVTKADFDQYKQDTNAEISGDNFLAANLSDTSNKNKDILFRQDKTINNLNTTVNLGYGGLVFEKGTQNEISGSGKITLGGLDIAENATVNWAVKVNEDLHKIGKGKLVVNAKTQTNLRVGEGEVELATKDAFQKMYITSGRAKVKLTHNEAENINGKVFFGNGGGVLDLNGKNQTVANFSANGNNARVQNSGSVLQLAINGDAGKDTIVHAQIGGNASKINLKNGGAVAGKHLVYDGGIDINGKMEISNKSVTLQAHPVVHAYLRDDATNKFHRMV
ncbi:MAG: anticodon nuclease, partial [Deltaproteobacteria bacterium]